LQSQCVTTQGSYIAQILGIQVLAGHSHVSVKGLYWAAAGAEERAKTKTKIR